MSKQDIADRLKQARLDAGFTSARSVALAMGWSPDTYSSHENGTRGLRRDTAQIYARKFKTTPEWLLYGKTAKPDPLSEEMLTALIAEAIQELPVGATIGDLPRLVAGVLHTQLMQLRDGLDIADRNVNKSRQSQPPQSPAATTSGDEA